MGVLQNGSFIRENANLKWMITRGTPISRKLHILYKNLNQGQFGLISHDSGGNSEVVVISSNYLVTSLANLFVCCKSNAATEFIVVYSQVYHVVHGIIQHNLQTQLLEYVVPLPRNVRNKSVVGMYLT